MKHIREVKASTGGLGRSTAKASPSGLMLMESRLHGNGDATEDYRILQTRSV